MKPYDPHWNAIVTELSFVEDLLGDGLTQIRRANYSRRGLYFQAFTNLSVGFERIGKVCVVIDYAIHSGGKYPDEKYLKSIGHDLLKLYASSQQFIARNKIEFEFLSKLDDSLHSAILDCLNSFAKGDRYHNIDSIVGAVTKTNPIYAWRTTVDDAIWQKKISDKRKRTIELNAAMIHGAMNDISYVQHLADDNRALTSVGTASIETGLFKAVAPYRQLAVLQMVRYWSELLSGLNYYNMKVARIEMPFFSDFLREYFNTDKILMSRKRWDNQKPWQW